MSELKVYVKPIKTNMFGKTIVGQSYYLKSEADKVIAELETKNASLTEELNEWVRSAANRPIIIGRLRQHIAVLDNELRHSNYKRCLAMADMNWWQANRYSAAEMVERIRGNFEEATQCSKLEEKYLKRYNKWLALAEEPTWAKFLQLIHKEDK